MQTRGRRQARSTFTKTITTGTAALGLAAAALLGAAPAHADTHAQWFNEKSACQSATDARAAKYRSLGYTVSVQTYCRGEQYIGFRPQYYSEIYYN